MTNPTHPIDTDAARSAIHDGPMVGESHDDYVERVESIASDLADEVDRVREMHTKLRRLYNKNVGALVEQLDDAGAENDRLRAANTRLADRIVSFGGAA